MPPTHRKALSGSRILLLGMAYKKDVDDPRESPATLQMLRHDVDQAKIALSERLTTQVNLPFITSVGSSAYALQATVTRAELDDLTRRRKAAETEAAAIRAMVMAGGLTGAGRAREIAGRREAIAAAGMIPDELLAVEQRANEQIGHAADDDGLLDVLPTVDDVGRLQALGMEPLHVEPQQLLEVVGREAGLRLRGQVLGDELDDLVDHVHRTRRHGIEAVRGSGFNDRLTDASPEAEVAADRRVREWLTVRRDAAERFRAAFPNDPRKWDAAIIAYDSGLNLVRYSEREVKPPSTDVLEAIRTEKQISDATMPKLKAAVDAFAKSFA